MPWFAVAVRSDVRFVAVEMDGVRLDIDVVPSLGRAEVSIAIICLIDGQYIL